MPVTINKQRLLTQLFAAQKKLGERVESEPRPVLEHLLFAVCREGTTQAKAERAYQALRERFFDWNEVRVSSIREIEDVLSDLPDAEVRAQRLIGLLQEVFETTFSFDLESLQKKGLKQAAKQIARYQASNEYIVAWVVQQSLGGHALPVDGPTLRVLRRTGFIENDQEDSETLRSSLEHVVPKARGSAFSDLVSTLADEICEEHEPHCARCPLSGECMTGQEVLRSGPATERVARTKPR